MTWNVSSKLHSKNDSLLVKPRSNYAQAKLWFGRQLDKVRFRPLPPLNKLEYNRPAEQKAIKVCCVELEPDQPLSNSLKVFRQTLGSSNSACPVTPTTVKSSSEYYESLQSNSSPRLAILNLIGCHNSEKEEQAVYLSFQAQTHLEIGIYKRNNSKSEDFTLFYCHPWNEKQIITKRCSPKKNLQLEVEKLQEEIRGNTLYRMHRVSLPPNISKLWQSIDSKKYASLKLLYKLLDTMDERSMFQVNPEIADYPLVDLKKQFKQQLKCIRKYGKNNKRNKKLAINVQYHYCQLYNMLRLISWYLQQPEYEANRLHILTNLALGSCFCSSRFKEEVIQAYRELTGKVHAPDLPPLEDLFAQWSIDYKEGLLDLTIAKMKHSQTSHIRFGIAMELLKKKIHTNTADFIQSEESTFLFQSRAEKGCDLFLREYHPYNFASYCQERLDDLLNSSPHANHYKASILSLLRESVAPYVSSNLSNNGQNLSLIDQYLTDQQLIIEDPEIDALKTTGQKGMYQLLKHFQFIKEPTHT